jgi:hypothetical protein
MFILMAPVVWFFEQAGRHPWLWLVVVAVVIGGWLLGREQDYTKPRKPRSERRPTLAQVRAQERTAFERRSAELHDDYQQTKDRIRRLSQGDGQ